jgi:hypothetical protein
MPELLDEPLPLVLDLLAAEDDAPGPQSMLRFVADEPVVPAVPAVPGDVPVPVLPVPAEVPAPPVLVCAIAAVPSVSAAIETAVRRRRLIDCSSLPLQSSPGRASLDAVEETRARCRSFPMSQGVDVLFRQPGGARRA